MRTWLDGVWSDEQKLTYLHDQASQIEYEFGELLDVSPFPIIHCPVEPREDFIMGKKSVIDRLPEYASPLVDILERIMTQHWDMVSCPCWVCEEARSLGCKPREMFLAHHNPEQKRPRVKVYRA